MSTMNVIQLIEQNNQGKLVINNEALKIIQNLNDQVGVIVAVGKKRLGKSFTLNRLVDIDSRNGFEISHIDEPCTKGIYMYSKIIDHTNKNGEKMKLILLDTEGLESKESSKEWDYKIFVLSLLLSSYFIYNTSGTYTRDDLEKLSFISQVSNKIRKNYSSEMDLNDFPELMWVCRDYKFEIKNENSGHDALKKFIKTDFETEKLNKTKDCFIKSFKNIDGFFLPYPDIQHQNGFSSKKLLLGIENYNWCDLSGEFCDEMNNLCKRIKENVQIKIFDKKTIKGNIFSGFIKEVVQSLNDEKTIFVVDMIEVLIKNDSNRILDQIKNNYSNKLKTLLSELPKEWELMNSLEEKIRNECLNELKNKIDNLYINEYEDLLNHYILNKKEHSGVFLYYINKNKQMIEQFSTEEFEKLKIEYRKKMDDKLSNRNYCYSFEDFENDLSNKIFSNFKEKLKFYSTNNSEPIINWNLFEEKFKKFRDDLEYSKKIFENYLEKEWQKITQEFYGQQSFSLSQFESSVSLLKEEYSKFSKNSPVKNNCWNVHYDRNYESLKKFILESEKKKKIQPTYQNVSSPCYHNFFSSITPPSSPSKPQTKNNAVGKFISNGSANGDEVFQGPLRGIYRININGKKTYVKKSQTDFYKK